MSALIELSPELQSMIQLWAFLLCGANIFTAIYAVTQKKYSYLLISTIPFAVSFLLYEIISDLVIYAPLGAEQELSRQFGDVYYNIYLGSLGLASIATLLLIILNFRFRALNITPSTIKLCIDNLPQGLCYWRREGRIILANQCIKQLYEDLYGRGLRNGTQLDEIPRDEPVYVGDRIWRFQQWDGDYKGNFIHMLVTTDITEVYHKTEDLERDAAELARLNEELRHYSLRIDDTIRQQEILQTKIAIHDEMNKLMLTTVSSDEADMDEIFDMWRQNALVLCRDNTVDTGNVGDDLQQLAAALKIELIWDSGFTPDMNPAHRKLMAMGISEALVNAAKHARAGHLHISVSTTDGERLCAVSNDGDMPEGGISPRGGLVNLDRLLHEAGGYLEIQDYPAVTLIMHLPEEGESSDGEACSPK